jgi:hypothetical protein
MHTITYEMVNNLMRLHKKQKIINNFYKKPRKISKDLTIDLCQLVINHIIT